MLGKRHSTDGSQKVPMGVGSWPSFPRHHTPWEERPLIYRTLTVMKTEVTYYGGKQLVPTPNLALSGYKGKFNQQ